MTTLNLACGEGHTFEAWFRSQAEFSRQHEAGLVACPWCGEREIERRPSVPNVLRSRGKSQDRRATPSLSESEAAGTRAERHDEADWVRSPAMQSFADALRDFHRYIESTCDDVGDRFAMEARKMHDEQEERQAGEVSLSERRDKGGDKERKQGKDKEMTRGIYGKATAEELRDLNEEGISVSPLPPLPSRYN